MDNQLLEKVLNKNATTVRVISTVALVITSLIAIAGGYVWLHSNVWKPNVEIVSVDFNNAVCHLIINGTEKTLYGNATLAAGASWGVRFGTTQSGMTDVYNTIELVKEDRVYEIYKINGKS